MNGYELSHTFFDWSFENPEKVSPNHAAIYFFAIEHCNRLGWKDKFGFPTQMTMDAIGIKKHHTYMRYFNDLIEWGFFKLIQKSTNQYSANIISLESAMPKKGKALGKATSKHAAKQTEPNGQSIGCIDKPITLEPKTIKEDRSAQFDLFWSKYPNKNCKKPAKEKFMKLSDLDIEKILMTVDAFAAYKQFKDYVHPMATTYLNQRRWEDEMPKVLPDQSKPPITRDVWYIARQIPAEMNKICQKYNLTQEEFNSLFK